MSLRYASVCDGIGAVHVAWQPLGWRCAWTSEIEPFPAAVVEHHWHLPNLGDMTKITEAQLEQHGRINVLVGGTPCQDLSAGGRRAGWWADRSGLSWSFLRLVQCGMPDWFVWENVRGALLGKCRYGFARFVEAFMQLGYGVAWRVLDARYFGLAQRRPRVFVVGSLGSTRSGRVLLESQGVQGVDSSPVPPTVSVCLTARGAGSLDDRETYVVDGRRVRHMTPRESERAMGFPDDYTLVPWRGSLAKDRPRYRAIGNSMPVTVMSWIGRRIAMADKIGGAA